MKCLHCGCEDSKVIDSRASEDNGIRRRRECLNCHTRFTTFETYEMTNTRPFVVIKKDGSLEPFDRNKILSGLLQACYKRPVTNAQLNRITESIEEEMKISLKSEFSSREIGEMVMQRLKELDDVSYVRFASVYREFKDVDTFMKELSRLSEQKQLSSAEQGS